MYTSTTHTFYANWIELAAIYSLYQVYIANLDYL